MYGLIDISGKTLYIPDLWHLAHAAGWEPYTLHDLGHFFLGWICASTGRDLSEE